MGCFAAITIFTSIMVARGWYTQQEADQFKHDVTQNLANQGTHTLFTILRGLNDAVASALKSDNAQAAVQSAYEVCMRLCMADNSTFATCNPQCYQ